MEPASSTPCSVLKMVPASGSQPKMAFPVTEAFTPPRDVEEGTEPQAVRMYTPLTMAALKELKVAVSQYGPTAAYTIAVLDSLTQGWIIPNEWKDLAKATLSGGNYLLWRSEFFYQCEDIARDNAALPNPWTLAMLTGTGDFATKETQIQFDSGLFAQINMAAIRVRKWLPSGGEPTLSLTQIKQKPEEPFSDFVDCLLEMAERLFGSTETNSALVKQLAYENATSDCQAAIRPHHKKEDLSGYIRLCTDIGPVYQDLAMAATQQGCIVTQPLSCSKKDAVCFKCGQSGHTARECKRKNQNQSSTKKTRLCPRCKRGDHWANECKSKRDVHSNPLPLQRNGLRGWPQVPNSGQTRGAPRFVPAKNHPFQTSSGQPQGVRGWTSVPPPTQY
ncbi:endogenous retrovirus group K member 6 Gag polyprotein-like [Cavia porcellus]|uniref:endogenous retrovirus group K member 6 Gag polyprotein-like n=1 Tax=Cavia porcellus TaxID=10141 RepID=UPI002FE19DEC